MGWVIHHVLSQYGLCSQSVSEGKAQDMCLLFNRFVTVLSHAADFIRNINFHHAAVAADAVVTIASVMCVSAITIICINTHSINIYIGECSSNKW